MQDEVLADVRDRMDKALEGFRKELTRVRTGRAHTGLLDGIRIEAYGSAMPLNQVATVSVPESRLIVIQPWDKGVGPAIEKAIHASDLGLTPSSDGKVIRIAIPPLTEERRKDLVKNVRKAAEAARVAVRTVRREGNELLKDMEKDKAITADELHRLETQVQKLTDEHVERLDKMLADKEKEVMEV
jgi:ribosome recycling factor